MTRGEQFLKTLRNEYETLVRDSLLIAEVYERDIQVYSYTETEKTEKRVTLNTFRRDAIHFQNALDTMGGAENGEPIPTVEETETPQIVKWNETVLTQEAATFLGLGCVIGR